VRSPADLFRRVVQKTAVRLFPVFEAVGLHVVPAHFYYPIPATRELTDSLFRSVSDCPGLDWNPGVQEHYLRSVFARYAGERTFGPNEGLNVMDAAMLHAMVRHHRPRKIVEVGSGVSTTIIAAALQQNAAGGSACEFVAIDPYPRPIVTRGVEGLTRLRRERVQAVPTGEFEDCDLLFIDSSHVVAIGSDVTYEQLEILPRLKPGCVVHFHDILLPGEYWRDWVVGQKYFWTEQYLLRAFLTFNTEFEVLWGSRYMQLTHEQDLEAVFPDYRPEYRITSFWVRRKPAAGRPA
jgi:predicted O-methyltransferase YrrM